MSDKTPPQSPKPPTVSGTVLIGAVAAAPVAPAAGAAAAPAAPVTRASFQHWTRLPIRWSDQDSMGHVNNAVIATYFEQARIEAVTPLLARHAAPGLDIVVARIAIDYRRELNYPGVVEIGTRLAEFGTRSFVLQSELFVGEKRIASCEATIVFFNSDTRVSMAPTEEVRKAIMALG